MAGAGEGEGRERKRERERERELAGAAEGRVCVVAGWGGGGGVRTTNTLQAVRRSLSDPNAPFLPPPSSPALTPRRTRHRHRNVPSAERPTRVASSQRGTCLSTCPIFAVPSPAPSVVVCWPCEQTQSSFFFRCFFLLFFFFSFPFTLVYTRHGGGRSRARVKFCVG